MSAVRIEAMIQSLKSYYAELDCDFTSNICGDRVLFRVSKDGQKYDMIYSLKALLDMNDLELNMFTVRMMINTKNIMEEK